MVIHPRSLTLGVFTLYHTLAHFSIWGLLHRAGTFYAHVENRVLNNEINENNFEIILIIHLLSLSVKNPYIISERLAGRQHKNAGGRRTASIAHLGPAVNALLCRLVGPLAQQASWHRRNQQECCTAKGSKTQRKLPLDE